MISGGIFDFDTREERLKNLDELMAASHFWDDQDAARDTIEESNRLKAWVRPWNELSSDADDLSALVELLLSEEDPDLEKELGVGLKALAAGVESMELRKCFKEDDHREAIVTSAARGRWARVTGLGGDADAHVHPLGGTPWLSSHAARPTTG